MKNKTIDQLTTLYLEENREDFSAFEHDKDEHILGKSAFNWACAQGVDKPKARLLSLHIVELAHQKFQ